MDPQQRMRTRMAEALRDSAVFGSLRPAVVDELVAAVEWREVDGGERLFSEGDPADSTLFVISGGLRATRHDENGRLLVYNQVHPGQSIGELAMILQQPRAQDVTALRDSTLAVLSRGAYEELLRRHPVELNRVFLTAIYEQLHQGTQAGLHPLPRQLPQTIAVVPLDAGVDAAGLCSALARALRAQPEMASLAHLSEDREGPGMLVDGRPVGHRNSDALAEHHELLLFEATADAGDWTRYAVRQSDQIVFVASAQQRDAAPCEVERRLMQLPAYALKRKHLVLMHAADCAEPVAPQPWADRRELERVYPLRAGSREDAEHLARFLTGTAVGVVLGGGGARGFAHLGALRALAEAGIAIDLIGGNSMGALIGAQLACGHSLEQIMSQTLRFALGGERPTVPLVSLMAGRRIERDLHKLFGTRVIERLWRPFFAAACNLSRGATQVQDRGPLWRAVLASNSPAGLLPPVVHEGELLVDGGILDNVPVQAMRQRLGTPLERRRGNGTIIAIDVDVPVGLRADPQLGRLSAFSTLKRRVSAKAPSSPSLAAILYSAGHVASLAQRPRAIAQADHYLEPPVGHFGLLAYRRGAEIAECGYRYTMESLRQWDRQPPLS